MFASLPGVELFYEESGEGETVVLIGGMGADHGIWDGLVPLLHGYRCIAPDNRGSGQTLYDGDFRIDDIADDVVGLMDLLGIDRFHAVGWSMGTQVCMSLGIRHPDRLGTATMIAPFVRLPRKSAYLLRAFSDISLSKNGDLFPMHVAVTAFSLTESQFEGFGDQGPPVPERFQDPVGVRRQIDAMERFDPGDGLCGISAPVLVVQGGEDILVPVRTAQSVRDALRDCTYVEVADAGHAVPPGSYAGDLRRFLADNPLRRLFSNRPGPISGPKRGSAPATHPA